MASDEVEAFYSIFSCFSSNCFASFLSG